MSVECKVSFVGIAADGKGRVYGLDRSGRVWYSIKSESGNVVHWQLTTDKGVRP